MAAFEFKITLDEAGRRLIAALRAAGNPLYIQRQMLPTFRRLGALCAGYIVKNKLSNNPVGRRSGQLAAAMVGEGTFRDGFVGFRVGILRGPALRYARVINEGAVIRPVRARALAIPVNDTLTPAGVSRYPGPRVDPRDLRFVPFRRGGRVIGALYPVADLRAARGQGLRSIRAAWLLMTEVTIIGRRFLQEGVREYIPTALPVIARALKEVLSRGEPGPVSKQAP